MRLFFLLLGIHLYFCSSASFQPESMVVNLRCWKTPVVLKDFPISPVLNDGQAIFLKMTVIFPQCSEGATALTCGSLS